MSAARLGQAIARRGYLAREELSQKCRDGAAGHAHFWALYFLQTVKKIDVLTSSYIVGIALLIATPTLIFWAGHRTRSAASPSCWGGMLLASLTYYPLYSALGSYAEPNNINYMMSILIVAVLNAASMPTCAYVGNMPITAVETPMPVSVTMNVYFRPTRSPSQPNTNAPSARIRKTDGEERHGAERGLGERELIQDLRRRVVAGQAGCFIRGPVRTTRLR